VLYLGEGARTLVIGSKTMHVFPDFSDPRSFYYLPNFPHVAKNPDGSPAIRLLVFREDLSTLPAGSDEAVGFLSLDVDLSWEPDDVERAARRLQLEGGLLEPPRLSPILFREGSARLLLLDAVTPDPGAPTRPGEDPGRSDFVREILGAASPSLYGDNRAIFQARLTKKGATVLSAALDGFTPIGVVYSLTFVGLQPAFHIKARVDWDKVYHHMSERHGVELMFVEIDIQNSIDALVESKAIQIDVTVEGIGEEAMDSLRNEAMQQIRVLIFEKFFEASFKRVDAAGDSMIDNVVDGISELGRAGLLGLGYSYSRKEVDISELRTLDLDWSARKATERKIYPQAHMHAILQGGAVTREQLVTVVDGGADAIWKTLGLQVIAAAAWKADGIAGISVDVEYDDPRTGQPRGFSTFLDANRPSAEHREWMDRTSGSRFRYKYEVVFSDEGVRGPRPKIDSGGFREHEGTVLVIHPRELYDSVALEVGAVPGFPFERWPAVQAVLRYVTDDGSFTHYADAVLKREAPSFTTRFRTDAGVPARRELRLTYIGAEGERVEHEWMPMPQGQWVVEDPHGNALEVRAIVAGDRRSIANLMVDLEYTDRDNGIHHTGNLSFDPENINKPQLWTVALADPTKRRYRYRMTLVTATGDFLQTGWISTDAPTLPVGEIYVRRLTVEIVTGMLAAGVTGVEVVLEYGSPGSDQYETQTFTLGADARAEWVVQLQDASRRDYRVTTTWIREDGFNPRHGPVTRSDTLLVIPGRPEER
jgi:hypothetical protein